MKGRIYLMSKKYTQQQYEKYLAQPANNTFGLSPQQVADWFMGQAGARPVINSYGVNASNLVSTYIPKMQEYGVSYTLFLMYTAFEGGGAGNWINHYMYDTGSNGLECLEHDLKYIHGIWETYFPPALSAPECYPATEDNAGALDRFYQSLPGRTWGDVMIPSTMAGNAWVWAYNYCVNNQGPAPLVYFGNPYDSQIDSLLAMGADPFTGGSSTGDGKNPSVGTGNATVSASSEANREKLKKALTDLFNNNLEHLSGEFYGNQVLNAMKYGTILKCDLTDDGLNAILKLIADVNLQTNPNPDKPTVQSPGQNDLGSGSDRVAANLANAQAQVGKYIGDGQCYAWVGWWSARVCGYSVSYSTGDAMLPLIGDGMNAHSIHLGWDWSIANTGIVNYPVGTVGRKEDLRVGAIWCATAFSGAPFYTGQYGHTGIIESWSDTTVTVLEQNILGSPVIRSTYDLNTFLSTLTGLITFK